MKREFLISFILLFFFKSLTLTQGQFILSSLNSMYLKQGDSKSRAIEIGVYVFSMRGDADKQATLVDIRNYSTYRWRGSVNNTGYLCFFVGVPLLNGVFVPTIRSTIIGLADYSVSGVVDIYYTIEPILKVNLFWHRGLGIYTMGGFMILNFTSGERYGTDYAGYHGVATIKQSSSWGLIGFGIKILFFFFEVSFVKQIDNKDYGKVAVYTGSPPDFSSYRVEYFKVKNMIRFDFGVQLRIKF